MEGMYPLARWKERCTLALLRQNPNRRRATRRECPAGDDVSSFFLTLVQFDWVVAEPCLLLDNSILL